MHTLLQLELLEKLLCSILAFSWPARFRVRISSFAYPVHINCMFQFCTIINFTCSLIHSFLLDS
uniref:Uncharacterized protein n=1 Tax=Rhizophora mucronata TaxID=61149 RepID=A0A2P2P5A5_RHIMU